MYNNEMPMPLAQTTKTVSKISDCSEFKGNLKFSTSPQQGCLEDQSYVENPRKAHNGTKSDCCQIIPSIKILPLNFRGSITTGL